MTGLPVVSLYGDSFRPSPDVLHDLDGVLCDLPDIGARYYTYAWTLTHVIDACAEACVPVWVLDRPNPLGGLPASVEGPLLESAFASFLGRLSIPARHSLTIGELALLWRAEACPAADVRVVPCSGWSRDRLWPDNRLLFVPTSPAIVRFEAALLYPGTCLFEATNLSVGRGSPLSFETVGSPWLRATELAARFADRGVPGVIAEPIRFTPPVGPWARQSCEAIRIRIVKPRLVRPVALGLSLLADVALLHPGDFRWSGYPTAANPGGGGHLERLVGTAAVREAIDAAPGAVDDDVVAGWTVSTGWRERMAAVALYD
jgi:uncharacterized protein YbbC (DUF1343 family)